MPFNLNSPKQGLFLEMVSKTDTKANSKGLLLIILILFSSLLRNNALEQIPFVKDIQSADQF